MFGTVIVLDSIELAHGSNMTEDLGGAPDRYRIGQKPYSSYEVVVDALAGNPLLQLDRVDASGTTVIQSGAPVTNAIDMTQSLRWENATASAQDSERVRVSSSSCPTNCTVNDVYRVRFYETTFAIPRYNQTGQPGDRADPAEPHGLHDHLPCLLLVERGPGRIANRLDRRQGHRGSS